MSGDENTQHDPARMAAELDKLRLRDKLLDTTEQLANIGHHHRMLACLQDAW